MMAEPSDSLSELFCAALELPPHEREAFLQEICGGDKGLRCELDALLAYEHRAASILDRPAMEIAAGLLAGLHAHAELPMGEQIGPYTVERLLGFGGMGEVYRATDTRLGRPVALKMLSPAPFAPAPVHTRVLREARAVSALAHPNVCTLFDVGEDRGKPYLVMELLEGKPLSEILSSKAVPYDQLLDWSIQIARGLDAAHSKGIIHCDIKPANLFITSMNRAKILDFGVAKLTQNAALTAGGGPERPTTTVASLSLGTPAYMSPEQLKGEPLDARTDLFSLGIVMLEMATGRRPTLAGLTNADEGAGTSADRKRSVPRRLQSVVAKLIEEHPADRYASAAELVRDLEKLERSRASRKIRFAALAVVLAAVGAAAYAWLRPVSPVAQAREWVQITRLPDSAVDPGLSADGSMLVFLRGARTFTPTGRLYAMKLPDGQPAPLTREEDVKLMAPVISPDGLSVAYTRIDRNRGWDTWSVPISGGEPAPILRNASGLSWIGTREILFSQIKTGIHMGIATADQTGQHPREIYVPAAPNGMVHRSYLSPDRRWVLAVEMDGTGWLPCRLLPFDGSSAGRQVGPRKAGCTSAAWSPDGKWMYVSSNSGGAFHIWRQRFPGGPPQQITFGASEEDGIAMSPDGSSFYTSVGVAASTIWIHDEAGERPLSEEAFSFGPQFSADGKTVYYMASPRAGGFWSETGELWAADAVSGQHRRLPLPSEITSFTVSADQSKVFFVRRGADGKLSLWASALDGYSAPVRITDAINQRTADNVFRAGVLQGERLLFATPSETAYVTGSSGATGPQRLLSSVIAVYDVSPDGNWLSVLDAKPFGPVKSPTMLYALNGGRVDARRSPIPLCVGCAVSWVGGGSYLHVQFFSGRNSEERADYLARVSTGDILPPLFRTGHLVTEDEVASSPGIRKVPRGSAFPAREIGTYVFTKRSVHRNIYRIPVGR